MIHQHWSANLRQALLIVVLAAATATGTSGCNDDSSEPDPQGVTASVPDVLLIGADAGDDFGTSVGGGGDFNGDGIDDVIVGVPNDDDGLFEAGAACIFFGSATPAASLDASAADVKLIGGDTGDRCGSSVAFIGDFNGDLFDDVIVGAPWDDDRGPTSGAAFIFFGSATPPASIDATAADVLLVGMFMDNGFGNSVAAAGDFNNDGFADVIVGASGYSGRGAAFVFLGSATPPSIINASAADMRIVGNKADDDLGWSVGGGGDFNGDTFDDVIVAAPGDDVNGSGSGTASIVFGSATPVASLTAASADVAILGAGPWGNAGRDGGLALSGDINGDGFADAVVDSSLSGGAGGEERVYVFFGSAAPVAQLVAGVHDDMVFVHDGTNASALAHPVAVGDVNGDGFSDLLGGWWASDNYRGVAFVAKGSAAPPASIALGGLDRLLHGRTEQSSFGYSIAFAGDFNNDGIGDFIVGARFDGIGGSRSGAASIFFGQ